MSIVSTPIHFSEQIPYFLEMPNMIVSMNFKMDIRIVRPDLGQLVHCIKIFVHNNASEIDFHCHRSERLHYPYFFPTPKNHLI